MRQPSLYFRELMGVSEMAKVLQLSEQRVRQLCDRGDLPCERGLKGERYSPRLAVKRLALERQVHQLMTRARKRGPKGPRRTTVTQRAPGVYACEFEAATA